MILNGPNTVEAYLRDLLADPASARPRQVLRSFTQRVPGLRTSAGPIAKSFKLISAVSV